MTKCNRITIIIGLLCTFIICKAQHPISSALQSLLYNGDFAAAKKSLRHYDGKDLSELPDSILFDYHYLKAAIKGNDGDEIEKRNHLIAAKDLCEKSQGIHSPVYLELCWTIGNSYENTGDTISAFEIYQAALVQSIGLYTLDDEDVKWQYEDMNNKVIEWYKNDNLRRKVIENRTNLYPRDTSKDVVQNDIEFYCHFYNDEVAKAKIAEADSLNSLAKWEEAAQIYLDIARAVQNNPIVKATVQELAALCLINIEALQRAEDLLLSNLEILEKNKQSREYRRTLSQLSNLYNAIHNYPKAKVFAEEAKFRYEENLDFSRGYILCLHRCATLERGNENYFLALLLEDVALQELYRNNVWDEIFGKNTTREAFLTNCLSSAASNYNQLGFIKDAYFLFEEAISIAEQNGLDASACYNNLAHLCIASRDFKKAVNAAQKAYHISDSEDNKILIGTTLCLSQFLAGQSVSADVIKECAEYLQSLVKKTFAFTSTEERRNFWSYFEYYFPLLNFLAFQTGKQELNTQIYDNILVEKGLLLRTTNNIRNQILSSGNSEDLALYDRLLGIRKKLPFLSQDESRIAKAEIERIDKYLTKQYSSYASLIKANEVTWSEIQNHLEDGDIAIEFYNIPEVKWHEDKKDMDGKYRYCAVTLRKGYDTPHIVPLFTQDKLKGLDNVDFYETDKVFNLIWKPLGEELNGVTNIYFAADRELHKIGIEYATTADGKKIGDEYNIHRLSSTRILAENRGTGKKVNAVLFGGLKYDMDKEGLVAESRSGVYHPTTASRAFISENLRYGVKYLPGTLKEVEDISQNFINSPRIITGISGTEESFKSIAGSSIDIIHLATHGFFWSDEDAKKRHYVSFLKKNKSQQSSEDYALLRSGLFFSGANVGLKGDPLPDDVEDGVLTALELSNMNLGNVDMVVLSACESGLGETSGEGVFGLQRGFKLAGANTLLMSLWKVDDTATRILMSEFYKNYLGGKNKQESLKLAQQYLRNYTYGEDDYSDPRYWAAFILLDAI